MLMSTDEEIIMVLPLTMLAHRQQHIIWDTRLEKQWHLETCIRQWQVSHWWQWKNTMVPWSSKFTMSLTTIHPFASANCVLDASIFIFIIGEWSHAGEQYSSMIGNPTNVLDVRLQAHLFTSRRLHHKERVSKIEEDDERFNFTVWFLFSLFFFCIISRIAIKSKIQKKKGSHEILWWTQSQVLIVMSQSRMRYLMAWRPEQDVLALAPRTSWSLL